ncbi:hypothetical protein GCM10010402_21450 [Actinomadura luteofluorescens]|nr:HTH-like domain-containing protein [Actinomadura glauciflava]
MRKTEEAERPCAAAKDAPSWRNRWRGSAPARAARVAGDARLAGRVRGVHAASGGVYGSPRVHAELREAGTMVNRKRGERVMREHGIVGRHQRRRYRTTVPAPAAAAVPDLLRRDFSIGRADERWCGDVTYLPVAGRWMFLATVIDIGTRRVVGYSMAEHMRGGRDTPVDHHPGPPGVFIMCGSVRRLSQTGKRSTPRHA